MTIPVDGASLGLVEPGVGLEGAGAPKLGGAVSETESFDQYFGEAIAVHSEKALEASRMAEAFAAGQTEDIHGTMIAIKEVEIELRVISNVRRKVVDAFQELWRMNI